MSADKEPRLDITTLDTFDMTVPVRVHQRPGMGMRMAFFKFSDCIVDVHNDRDDIGSYGGVIGGFYEFNFHIPDSSEGGFGFVIHPIDMWNAMLTALEQDGRYPEVTEQMQKVGYQDLHLHQSGRGRNK